MNFYIKHSSVINLFISVVFIMSITMLLAMYVLKAHNKWVSMTWFLNGERKFSFKILFYSMISAMVFGFIDNAGLFFGMSALDKYLPGGNLEKAGWGNTFSDGVGAFMGAFVAKIISLNTGFDGQGPIYGDFLGVIIGCIFGIYVPKLFTSKS